jgi:hypothetical protein
LIQSSQVIRAVQSLHDAFQLDRAELQEL